MALEKMRDLLKHSLGHSLHTLPEEDRLALAWPVVCGKAMAEHGAVIGFAGGVLQVQVADEAWRQQFFTMQGQLAAELSRIAAVKVTGIHWKLKRNDTK